MNRILDLFRRPAIQLLFSLALPVSIAFIATAALTVALSENPTEVFKILAAGSLGSPTAIGYTLYYSTPLIFTGLAVAWAFQSGLFNIGADGQMTVGGIAMASIGILFPSLSTAVALPMALMAGFSVGALWGYAVIWLKIKKGVHEVLGSILFNFISYGLAGFIILDVLRNPDSQNPETLSVGPGYLMGPFFDKGGTSPLSTAFLIAILTALVLHVILSKTYFGLKLRWVGGAVEHASRAGVPVTWERLKAFVVSGGVAGLAASPVILGHMHKAREGFAANAGFVGIAVALLGGSRPLGVVIAAILFGALQKGSLDLDLDTENISRDLAAVIQALVVISVAATPLFNDWGLALRKKISFLRRGERGI